MNWRIWARFTAALFILVALMGGLNADSGRAGAANVHSHLSARVPVYRTMKAHVGIHTSNGSNAAAFVSDSGNESAACAPRDVQQPAPASAVTRSSAQNAPCGRSA